MEENMSFLELVKMRHSVRNYENRAVEKKNWIT